MADTSQGDDWWLAPDGKWYPPEPVEGSAPTPNPWKRLGSYLVEHRRDRSEERTD